MKRVRLFMSGLGILAAVVVVYALAVRFTPGNINATTAVCHQTGSAHMVTIRANVPTPAHTQAKLCDRLKIVNDDNITRLMAFGDHDHHEPYDGVTEKILTKGQSLTVTLDQTGTFLFHDHLHDEVQGSFTVTSS